MSFAAGPARFPALALCWRRSAGTAGPAAAAGACAPDRVDLRWDGGRQSFAVEVADDPAERARGLMGRESLPVDQGMLFVYESPRRAQFWMKDTLIPLDMIFADARGVVTRIHPMAQPLDLTPVDGGEGVKYVLEINGGLAGRIGLSPAPNCATPPSRSPPGPAADLRPPPPPPAPPERSSGLTAFLAAAPARVPIRHPSVPPLPLILPQGGPAAAAPSGPPFRRCPPPPQPASHPVPALRASSSPNIPGVWGAGPPIRRHQPSRDPVKGKAKGLRRQPRNPVAARSCCGRAAAAAFTPARTALSPSGAGRSAVW